MANNNCCPTEMKPVASGYTPKGSNFYIVGDGPKGIVMIPDIFGLHPNAYQFADVLAAHGFRVVLPDYFRGEHWKQDWPPNFEGAEWKAFFGKITNFAPFKNDVASGAAVLRGLGATSIGVIGMCWGAKVALSALKDGTVSACCGPHPSFLDVSDVTDAKGPICLLLSKDEAPALDVKEVLETNQFKDKNVFSRYDDLYHGFLGARGPLEKAFAFDMTGEIAHRVQQATMECVEFFKKAL
jgi:dienelactone hydrolase